MLLLLATRVVVANSVRSVVVVVAVALAALQSVIFCCLSKIAVAVVNHCIV